VTKRLGDGRFEVLCIGDGAARLAHVRGKLWNRVWVTPNDIVLVTLRAFQDQKVDIVHKYSDDEARLLERSGEIAIGALPPPEDDGVHEAGLQATRDMHGLARAGFLPSEAEFGFCEDVGEEENGSEL